MQRSMLYGSVLFALLFCTAASFGDDSPKLVSVTKIWDQGKHNAFTDLIRGLQLQNAVKIAFVGNRNS